MKIKTAALSGLLLLASCGGNSNEEPSETPIIITDENEYGSLELEVIEQRELNEEEREIWYNLIDCLQEEYDFPECPDVVEPIFYVAKIIVCGDGPKAGCTFDEGFAYALPSNLQYSESFIAHEMLHCLKWQCENDPDANHEHPAWRNKCGDIFIR